MRELKYKLVTLEEVKAAINEDFDVAFDTEADGFYGTTILAQFYQQHWDEALMVVRPEPFLLLALLTTTNANLVMQNVAYDVSAVQTQSGMKLVPKNLDDTLLLARHAYPRLESFSLDNIMAFALEFDPYAAHGIAKSKYQKLAWGKVELTPDVLTYAAIDVFYLLDTFDKIKSFKSQLSYQIDIRALKRALDFQTNGLYVVGDRLDELRNANVQKIREIALPINCNSWQQVRPYIGEDESTDLDLARFVRGGNDKAAAVRATRKATKLISFLDKFDRTKDHEGRIYGKFGPYAKSGRFTCKDQNLQQIPRASKGCFGAPEGRKIVFADFAQLELRTIAASINDRTLVNLFRMGEDPHGYTAEKTFGAGYTPEQRRIAKTENFNLLYGGSAGMLQSILLMQADVWLETDEVAKLIRVWKRAFPGIVKWQTDSIRDFKAGRLGESPFGRKYKAARITDHMNIYNQASGADVAKLAMQYVYDDLKPNDSMMVNFIHDSYKIETPDDPVIYQRVARLLAEAMKDAWSEFSKMTLVKDLQMPVEVGVGSNWGDIEKGITDYSRTY